MRFSSLAPPLSRPRLRRCAPFDRSQKQFSGRVAALQLTRHRELKERPVMGPPRPPHRLTFLERLKARGMRALGCAFAVCLSVLTIVAVVGAGPAAAQPAGEVEALHEQAAELYKARKYGEAMPIAQQALALGEQRFGQDDARLGKLLYGVA